MGNKEKTRLLSTVLSVLVLALIIQTFMIWFFPQPIPSWESSTGTVSLRVFEPAPEPSFGRVTLNVEEGNG